VNIKLDVKDMLNCYLILKEKIEELSKNDILEFEISNENVDFKAWVDLSQILFCKMLTPRLEQTYLKMRFKKLNKENSFHHENETIEEKYGSQSTFATIDYTI